ncbi:MAG: response regulator [Candidatus Eremiobacteraeota bacterium]|nr:response regulator [Candidatus Eremiobacteraeota bacterium]
MESDHKSVVILMADDDDDDYMLTMEAFQEARLLNPLYRVKNGEELMDYLLRHGEYKNPEDSPRPGLILLDLNMPRKDGREALKEIKTHENLRNIPVLVLTVSGLEDDILQSYDLGANSYIKKPTSFNELVEIIRTIGQYWLDIVELPDSQ